MVHEQRQSAARLPQPATPFIGREKELAEVTQLLGDPACRLLTIVGPGGVGKTRLALQIASLVGDDFADGIFYIPLESLISPETLLPTLVTALDLHVPDQQEVEKQLLAYLQERQLLLLLDSFETLRESAGLLARVLAAAPQIQLLVTSREPLALRGEWLFPLHGLAYPDSPVAEAEAYGAVALFASRARQIQPSFSLAEEAEQVIRICQQTEGLPLALELAASWVRILSCAEIAAELQRNLDLLTSPLQDVPAQHRSMRAVFQQSWSRLRPEEQRVFAQLSVFRGGFTREAAEAVAGASLPVLSALLDRSLLRREPSGRYHVHPLLRQFGTEQLTGMETAASAVRRRHGAYYVNFLQERTPALRGSRQRAALAEIAGEQKNVEAAWAWALAEGEVDFLAAAVEPLNQFYDFRGHYLDGIRALEEASERLSAAGESGAYRQPLALARIYLAGLYLRVGRIEDAEDQLLGAQEIYRQLEMAPPPGYFTDPALYLGLIASVLGDYEEAERRGQEALQAAQASNHLLNQQAAHYLLARASLLQDRLEEARLHARQSYVLTTTTGDRWFMAYCLNELGNVAFALGDVEAARQHYAAGYKIRREFEDPEGMAVALNHLADVTRQQGDYQEAERLYSESLAISKRINNRGSAATALLGLAGTAVARDKAESAAPLFQQALQLIREGQFVALFLHLLVDLADLLAQREAGEQAAALLALVAAHPGSEPAARQLAQQRLARTGSRQTKPAVAADAGWPALERLAIRLQAELEMAPETARPLQKGGSAGESDTSTTAGSALVETLTDREAEVLALIAEGLSNPEIAERLVLAVGTVKYYTSEIYGKLGVRNRVEAVSRARELDLLD